MSDSMLDVSSLICGYGDVVAVDNLSFTIGAGLGLSESRYLPL